MSTDIRPSTSERSPYHISKERYYELKHFCMQYGEWKEHIKENDSVHSPSYTDISNSGSDRPLEIAYERIERFKRNIDIVERTAKDCDPFLWVYILKAVTDGYTYSYLRTVMDIPCCRDVFYSNYRKFFYLLAERRE